METVALTEAETSEPAAGVFLTPLAHAARVSVQHVRLDPGAAVPEHRHEQEQAGFVFAGEQTFVVKEEPITVTAGDSYALHSNKPHALENRGDDPTTGVAL